jgi:hypothetical protein
MICTAHQDCSGDKIDNGVDWACSVYEGRGVVFTGYWWGNLRERDHWGDPDVDSRFLGYLCWKRFDSKNSLSRSE